MGFIAQGLGPTDSAVVSRMGPEIVRVLRRANADNWGYFVEAFRA